MKIVRRLKDNRNGRLLVIYESRYGDLVGEIYYSGVRKAGRWDSRATFPTMAKDCSEFRVREYFNFNSPEVVEIS